MSKRILVTGGNGYIGSHLIKQLAEHGHRIDVIDYNPHQNLGVKNYLSKSSAFNLADITAFGTIDLYYDVIIHLAALISVEQSIYEPSRYYFNNLQSTQNLLRRSFYDHFIFASTGAAFDPTSPYARSKVACEDIIREYASSSYSTILRFYNVSGLDPEFHPTGTPTHLIRRAAMAAAGKLNELTVYGTDFSTRDGTCVRDYVHVLDLADAICNTVEHGPSRTEYECIGSGAGFTVKEIITSMKQVTGIDFQVIEGPKRLGDAPSLLTPNVSKFMDAKRTINDMCLSAFDYERKTK